MSFDDFCEVHIETDDLEYQQMTIDKLYKSFLHSDDSFHFLHEPDYLLIRFDSKKKKDYIKRLNRYKFTYGIYDTWDEDSVHVTRYIDFFADYFHIISVLVLENESTAWFVEEIMERVVHTLHNVTRGRWKEHSVLASITLGRAIMYGITLEKQFAKLKEIDNA